MKTTINSYRFYISSENEGKVREIKQYIKEECKVATEIIPLTINHLTDEQKKRYNPVEDGESFLENARIKARALFSIVNAPVIADDSGLEVDLLNGDPGVFSSRYEKTDELRIAKLLNELKNQPSHLKTARFISCICFIDKTGNEIFFNGKVEGLIINEPRGKNGFGYDPVFLYQPMNKTFGELLPEEKQVVSHRSKALKLFLQFLDRYIA
ncbi:MAG: RdgB/HAM1 family non-canonical purine NTP pyrophosphatase [Spirochaetia bacterium]|nr:RdgB/HAM1 family non-canonical purine NTP pyrophosphatase [Spirochaetia bacterium]